MSKSKSESESSNGNQPSEGKRPSIEVHGPTSRGKKPPLEGDELQKEHKLTMNLLLDLHIYTAVTLFTIRGIETLEYSLPERNSITNRGTPTL